MKRILLLCFWGVVILSCSNNPKKYESEINDAARFFLAIENYTSQVENNDVIISLRDKIIEEYEKGTVSESDCTLKNLLLDEVREKNYFAKRLYLEFESVPILFSEYSKVSDGKWEVEELLSNVRFVISIGDRFEVEPNEKDMQHYAGRLAFGEKLVEFYELNNIDVDSLIDAELAKAEKEEKTKTELINIAKRVYSGKEEDETVLSPRFYKELKEAFALDNDLDGWAEYGYWKFENGRLHKFKVEDCVLEGSYAPYVILSLSDTQFKSIALCMVKKSNSWYVNDVLALDNNGRIVYSLSDLFVETTSSVEDY